MKASSDFVNIKVVEGCCSGPEIKIRSESTSWTVKQPTQARPGQMELALQPPSHLVRLLKTLGLYKDPPHSLKLFCDVTESDWRTRVKKRRGSKVELSCATLTSIG